MNSGTSTYAYTIPANSFLPVFVPCDFVHCIQATAPFYLRTPGGNKIYMGGNKKRRFDYEADKGFELVNETGVDIHVLLIVGFGDYFDGDVTIGNMVDVEVQNWPVIQKTDDDETQAKLDTLTAAVAAVQAAVVSMEGVVTALLENDHVKRASLTTLKGATYAIAAGGTVTFVAAGANVNGVIVRSACALPASGNAAQLQVDGNIVLHAILGNALYCENIYIPPGKSLVGYAAAGGTVSAWYEVL